MQPAGIVFLYYESVFRDLRPFRLGFSRVTEISLSGIFFERHKLVATFRFSAKRFKAIKRQISNLTADNKSLLSKITVIGTGSLGLEPLRGRIDNVSAKGPWV